MKWLLLAVLLQVHSPHVIRKGQVDTRTVESTAATICERAGARTPREKAEAIWRFFLTDGRFVEPGFWYHIAGWAYEEPHGEVLDPVKLLNGYGFGLCYQIAPLLEAIWEAAGLDARVWFLNGHTVAEVFYDGAWHHYDSDLMGYTETAEGVISVRQIEREPRLLLAPFKPSKPWYPGDVRAGVMNEVAGLFSSASDNRLFPYTRYPQAHTMDFVLRPGERMIRYFRPESPDLFYLPFQHNGERWSEFPREVPRYKIRTEDGPRSQRDARLWATGRIEYAPPPIAAPGETFIDMPCPYPIIDAKVSLAAALGAGGSIDVELGGEKAALRGPAQRRLEITPRVIARSEHGAHTAVSGRYGYRVRLMLKGRAEARDMRIVTRFQHNPRALPALEPGSNEFAYWSSTEVRRRVYRDPVREVNVREVVEQGQSLQVPREAAPAELVYELHAPHGFHAGGRFIDTADGSAPDKLTAEVRRTAARAPGEKRAASLAWSMSPAGPYRTIWEYDDRIDWRGGDGIDRLLRWPEVDRTVRPGAERVYVRYRFEGLALDSVRLSTFSPAKSGPVTITHVWREDGVERSHTERTSGGTYSIPAKGKVSNEALVFEVR